MARCFLVLVLLAATAASSVGAWQDDRLVIVSPRPDGFISDTVTLEARVEPASSRGDVKEVTFFVDGKQVCASTDASRPRCTWEAGPVVRPRLVRAVAVLASGERLATSIRTRGVNYVDSVTVRAVQVNVSVVDRRGAFVRGLTADRFRILEDKVPQRITHFADQESPLELVLAVDVSGSMVGVVEELKAAAREFMRQMRADDRVTLVAFNEEMFVLARRETDAAARDRAVDALAAWGGTSLYDVIVRSLDLLSRQPGRRALVVFSDGEDRSSQTTLDTVDRAVKASDATLVTVALGRGREVNALRETLETLAEPSGGRVIVAERAEDLGRAFGRVIEDLKQQYLIGYEPTNTKQDGTWRTLSVEVAGDQRYRVRARSGYLAAQP